MDFFEVIQKRRSVRKFSKTVVPDSVVQRALEDALLAPNSSNMQTWEFYWVNTSEKKKKLVEACLGQPAAATASHLVVAVSRLDTWKRNCQMMVDSLMSLPTPPPASALNYYTKLMPFVYTQDPFGIIGLAKKIVFSVAGLWKPVPRGPCFRKDLFEVATKSTALACENFMLSVAAQGYASCPMEGFDELRVKKLLGLNRHCHVVMVMAVGEALPEGVYGSRVRFDKNLFLFKI